MRDFFFNLKSYSMNKIFSVILIFLFGLNSLIAQTVQVSGVVTSADDGQPLPGVSVVEMASVQGTVTNTDGRYTISVPSNGVLQFAFVGKATQEIAVDGRTVIDVELQSAFGFDELVVIGYGTQLRRDVTSAISTVRGDAIRDIPNVSIDQTLQGRATGVQITTPGGIVGQPPIVRIRGVNSITSGTSPLYVVDGVPIYSGDIGRVGQANALADVNPADILSVDILKDAAAAALYGSRAANGVILITTRTGARDRVRVTYDGWVGFTMPTNFAEVMNAQQYVDFKNLTVRNQRGTDEVSLTAGHTNPWGNKAYNLMTDSKGNVIDSDWKETIFQTGISHNHTVSVSGGSPRTAYFFSGNSTDQDGMVIGDAYSRIGVRANASVNATDWLKLGGNMSITSSRTSYVDAARVGSTFAVGGFPRLAMINVPNIPIYNEDGTPYFITSGLGHGPNTIASTFSNPAQLVQQGNYSNTDVIRYIVNFTAEIQIIDGLNFKTLYGKDNARTSDERFWSPLHGDGVQLNGRSWGVTALYDRWTWTNTIDYGFNFNRHNFNLLAGMEANESNVSAYGIERRDLSEIKHTSIQGTYITNVSAGMSLGSNAMISYLGRINYDFDGKYILSLNARRDGYSALGENTRWGNFGGVSAGWVVSDEEFFSPLSDIVSRMKIRASWGTVGNTGIADYASRSYYNSSFYGDRSLFWLGQIGDPNLKWETSTKWDIGFDATLFDRVHIDFDYYHTKTDDLILLVPQAPSKGMPGSLRMNAGQIENKGIEFTISADVVRSSDFRWNTSFNVSTNANKVLSLAEGVDEILGGDASALEVTNITVEGKSIGQLYVAQTRGIDPATGRRIFVTGDGEELLVHFEDGRYYYRNDPSRYRSAGTAISTDDYAISGNTLPTYYGGWTNSFRYKGLDASLFFQFSGGNKVLNGTKATLSDMRYWNNAKEVLDKHWVPGKTDAIYAHPIYGDNHSNGSFNPISDWIEKGDYIRLKNLIVGYTFSDVDLLNRAGISSIRIYGQAQNLFTITGYTGLDPEALSNVGSINLAGGVDKNTMPQAKIYTLGLNVTF